MLSLARLGIYFVVCELAVLFVARVSDSSAPLMAGEALEEARTRRMTNGGGTELHCGFSQHVDAPAIGAIERDKRADSPLAVEQEAHELPVAQLGVFELNAEARALASRGFVEEHALGLRR
jgi:hypothetical protein